MLKIFPGLSIPSIISSLYPWKFVNLKKTSTNPPKFMIEEAYKKFGISKSGGNAIDDFVVEEGKRVHFLANGSKKYSVDLPKVQKAVKSDVPSSPEAMLNSV